jgi:hypothetical protein
MDTMWLAFALLVTRWKGRKLLKIVCIKMYKGGRLDSESCYVSYWLKFATKDYLQEGRNSFA